MVLRLAARAGRNLERGQGDPIHRSHDEVGDIVCWQPLLRIRRQKERLLSVERSEVRHDTILASPKELGYVQSDRLLGVVTVLPLSRYMLKETRILRWIIMVSYLPNLLTLSRIAAIPAIIFLVAVSSPSTDFGSCMVFSAAALTDYFDGKLARSLQQQSHLGSVLDPIADKLLVGAALMILVGCHKLSTLGLYPAIIIMLREILVSGLREYLGGIRISLPVTLLAKWKTVFQMAAIGILLAGNTSAQLLGFQLCSNVVAR